MVCSRCGKPLPANTSFCVTCNAPAIAPLKTAGLERFEHRPAHAAASGSLEYAGFWLRVLAYAIDSIVIGVAGTIASGIVGGVARVLSTAGAGGEGAAMLLGALAALVTYWLYFALMESSGRQASLGKMALGLTVTDADGARIGFGRATGRYFGKIVSAIPLGIGFLLAGFTGRKQALHDMMAGTLVVRRGKSGVAVIVGVVVAVAFVGIAIVGMLAAIAIPNFLRYQLRAKSSEAPAAMAALWARELAHQQETGRFVPLQLPASGDPGPTKTAWSGEDLAAARALGWTVEGATYFTYRVAVARTADGREAFSICAESDLDGDGTHAAYVLWQPTVNEAGNPDAAPPVPPCAHDPAVERSPAFEPGDPIGKPVRISPADVF
jgi:uncharacterized RDD family membrane protein YckC/type II secretory pathway pseudopilin PulG